MKKLLLILIVIGLHQSGFSQVGINTTSPNAQLDIKSSNQLIPANTDGILIPKIDAFPLVNPTAAQNSMLVYLTTISLGKAPGFYYWDNPTTSWKGLGGDKGWDLPGNTVSDTTKFVGSINSTDLIFKSSNHRGGRIGTTNTSIGRHALNPMTFGTDNSAFGKNALNSSANGSGNSAVGVGALLATTNGNQNTAIGFDAGNLISTGSNNIAVGAGSNVPSATANNQMSIGNVIYGADMSTTALGKIGIGVPVPTVKLDVKANSGAAVVSAEYLTPGNGSDVAAFSGKILPSALSSGKFTGLKNELGSFNNVEVSGVLNTISGSGMGLQHGFNNQFISSTPTTRYGLFNSFNASAATNIGMYNEILGSGIKYGTFNNFTDGNGVAYGSYNKFAGTGNAERYGSYTTFWDNGSGDWYGSYVSFEYLSSTGATGKKYGYYVAIPPAVGGPEHYGVYSYAGDLTRGYSAYLSGRVSIGSDSTLATHYILPLSRGTNGQIMQSDAVGNVTWQNPGTVFGNIAWSITGNSGTSAATNFLGTTDNVDMIFKRFNLRSGLLNPINTSFGVSALAVNTGLNNAAFGASSLAGNTTGSNNSAFGQNALGQNTKGGSNFAFGYNSMGSNTTASSNIAIGANSLAGQNFSNGGVNYDTDNISIGIAALFFNNPTAITNGIRNLAIGSEALGSNSTGSDNIGFGYHSIHSNSVASKNIAIGNKALYTQNFVNGGNAYDTNNIAIGFETLYTNNPTTTSSGNENGVMNVAVGNYNMRANTTGGYNASLGTYALNRNRTGNWNTAIGHRALMYNTTGGDNTATGFHALYANIDGGGNTAVGMSSLSNNTSGDQNVAVGAGALLNNSSGNYNTGVGYAALTNNANGNENIAIGNQPLRTNSAGSGGIAIGARALGNANNTTTAFTNRNIAIGFEALEGSGASPASNTGNQNVAMGYLAITDNISGSSNTAIGDYTMVANTTGNSNVALGQNAFNYQISGSFNTCIGVSAYPTSSTAVSNYTGIGYNVGGGTSLSNMVELGNTFITTIRAQVTGITAYSDRRIKNNIQENVPGLQFITKLRPVTYNLDVHKQNQIIYRDKKTDGEPDWEGKYDIEKVTQTGFIAQEVAEAAQASNYDFNGVAIPKKPEDLYGVNYTSFVVPLVKAVQEQQEIIETQNKKIEQLEKVNQEILKRLEKLESK